MAEKTAACLVMWESLGDAEKMEAARSNAYWAAKKWVKLPFCLRPYRLKHYAKRLMANIDGLLLATKNGENE
jgi:hypothetical protein